MQPRRITFLYTELAGYFLSCLESAALSGIELQVIHWPVNPEAPFDIDSIQGVRFIEREGKTVDELVGLIEAFSPDTILCSGWIDKGYIKALRKLKSDSAKVLLMDNQWTGGFKQHVLSRFIGPLINRVFSHAWVAGPSQREFALKMGFPSEHVETGFYAADSKLFLRLHEARQRRMTAEFPRSFVYLGRYVEHKGIFDMWEAFLEAQGESGADWEMVCIGTGDRFEDRPIHDRIRHLGFKQPTELTEVLSQQGVFVLPSHFEPWGVVVQEMALAGFPTLLSQSVGAASTFLEEGENGFSFPAKDKAAIKQAMLNIMNLDDEQLRQMGARSHVLGQSNSPQKWAATLTGFS